MVGESKRQKPLLSLDHLVEELEKVSLASEAFPSGKPLSAANAHSQLEPDWRRDDVRSACQLTETSNILRRVRICVSMVEVSYHTSPLGNMLFYLKGESQYGPLKLAMNIPLDSVRMAWPIRTLLRP
jgi:hypothetical protein